MNVYAHATREAKHTPVRLLDKAVGGNYKKLSLASARKGKSRGKYIRLECKTGETP